VSELGEENRSRREIVRVKTGQLEANERDGIDVPYGKTMRLSCPKVS